VATFGIGDNGGGSLSVLPALLLEERYSAENQATTGIE